MWLAKFHVEWGGGGGGGVGSTSSQGLAWVIADAQQCMRARPAAFHGDLKISSPVIPSIPALHTLYRPRALPIIRSAPVYRAAITYI